MRRSKGEQPWAVYKNRRGRCFVRQYIGNGGLVALMTSRNHAREFAKKCNEERRGTRETA